MKNAMILIAGVAGLILGARMSVACGDDDCDMKTVQQGSYCKKCDKLLEKEDLASDGDCKTCDVKPVKVKVCVKKYYECACGKMYPKPGTCCGAKTSEKVDKARILFKCATCGATADGKEALSHDSGCKKKDARESCSKSGTKPHVKKLEETATDRMTPYRSLADDAFKAFKSGDAARAKQKAKELEKAWDTTGKSDLAKRQDLWKTIDTAMDVFIEPLTKGGSHDAAKVESAYKDFIEKLNRAAKP